LLFILNIPAFAQQKENRTPQVKNIILMIGDGMGVAHIYADVTANKGETNFSKFTAIGFSKTYSASDFTTESAAGSTAFSIGVKTHNRGVGVNKNNKPMPNIREIAQKHGLSTGVVVTTDLTDATPADFIAHVKDRGMHHQIAKAYINSGVNVFIGAEKERFYNPKKRINLIPALKKKGYQIARTQKEIKKIKGGKLAGLLKEKWAKERGNQEEVDAKKAIQLLNQNPKGFFLVIEGSKIDGASHDNNFDRMVAEVQDFDRVIGEVLDFAKKNGHTLVIVTADHETGGLVLTGGNMQKGEIKGRFMVTHHTPVMVPVFAYGPGAKSFIGIYNNNMIFHKMMNAFGYSQ
jgi:alkaline phosphatase